MLTPFTIPGPRGPISCTRDALGYPRIRARDVEDGAFARGFMHAMDRTVQLQLTLVGARGELMSVLGDKPLARRLDRAVRSFDFQRDLAEREAELTPRTRRFLQAYCDGVNAGMTERGWPVVLRMLGVRREPFTIRSIMLAYRLVAFFGLTSMVQTAELVVGELAARGVPASTFELLLGDAGRGIDLPSLAGVRFSRDASLLELPNTAGSNAFAVSSRRSSTGGALLMGEFHMETARFPPILYATHIDYEDGGYYQGLGVPGFAWISAGRTKHVGWSYTFAHGDNFDVLIERCENGRYLADGEWRPFDARTEKVEIRGKRAETWTFHENAYGTLLGDPRERGDYPSIRWSGLRDITRDLEAVRACMDATNVKDLAEAHRGFRVISLEGVLADDAGDVARVHTGQIDVRPAGWTGAYPRKGWDLASRTPAVLGEETRPMALGQDVVVSANQRMNGPNGEVWCSLPEPRYRHERLSNLMADPGPMDLRRLARASYDEHDGCAARLVPIWAKHLPEDADAIALRRWASLQGERLDDTSRRLMSLFHALHEEVVRQVLAARIGETATARIVDGLSAVLFFQDHIDDALALEKPAVLAEAELAGVLARAWPVAKAQVKKGHDVPVRTKFKNVLLQGKLPTALGFDTPPVLLPGGPVAPFQSRVIEFEGEQIVGGPAFHLVMDMSKPGAWYHVPGGAAEKRYGPGYGAGVDEWLRGEFLPLGDATGAPPNVGRGAIG